MIDVVTLQPGQTLRVLVNQQVANGVTTTSHLDLDYDTVKGKVYKPSKKLKGSTPEGRASRAVCLFCRAIDTGKWSTGVHIDRNEMVGRLVALLNSLSDEVHSKLSSKAIMFAEFLCDVPSLTEEAKDALAAALRARSSRSQTP